MPDAGISGGAFGESEFAEADVIHVAEIEIRWCGGDSARVRECIDIGLEIAVQLIGGFDDHGLGPGIPPDLSLLPTECASFQRFVLADPEAPGQ